VHLCGRAIALIAGSNPAGATDVSLCEYRVLSGTEVSETGRFLAQRSPNERVCVDY